MKKKELIQVKGLDVKELRQKANTLQKEIADLVLEKNMKNLKDVKSISKKKKELAQILTTKRQKELLGQIESRVKDQQTLLPAAKAESSEEEKVEKKEKTKSRKEKSSH